MKTTNVSRLSGPLLPVLLWGMLWLGVMWGGSGCDPAACQTTQDCATGQICAAGRCQAAPADGGEASVEPLRDGQTDAEPTAPDDAGVTELPQGEPLPPDVTWTEGRFPLPEALREGQTPPSVGTRKKGESCDPARTALAADRCAKDLRCAPPFGGAVGVCQTSCDPANPSCATGEACGPVIIEGTTLGHACGPASKEGFPCAIGRPCDAGLTCVTYGTNTQGMCLKACQKKADCGNKWCASGTGLDGKGLTACVRLVEKEGESCSQDAICGSGLVCVGPSHRRVCLKQGCNAQTPCPTGQACVQILDNKGQPLYSACFPTRGTYESCDSANRCISGHLCATFSQQPPYKACLKDCATDPQTTCTQNEICVDITSSRKGCLQLGKEGDLCDGPLRCDKGLRCLSLTSGGPRFCMRDCAADATACQAPAACRTLKLGGNEEKLCVTPCQGQAPACQAPATCQTVAGQDGCFPTLDATPGQKKPGEACLMYPGAPASMRCAPTLMCLSFAEGLRCAKLCDPAQPACEAGQSCLYDPQTQRSLCGTSRARGESCDASQASLCTAGERCIHPRFSSQGTCVADTSRQAGDLCAPVLLVCAPETTCAGDPTLPYRWLCRSKCSATQACPGSDICLQTTTSSACFPPCGNNDICPSPEQQCLSIQGQKVCL